MKKCVGVILAGGKGTRLDPLTRNEAKPAVPFGGAYRLIDFTLSNCLNSGLRRLLVLTQYKAFTLDRHLTTAWNPYFCRDLGEFLHTVPPQHQLDEHWYCGTADAVYQNIFALEQELPEHVVILSGDHVYKMDYRRILNFHRETNAQLTISGLRVSRDEAKRFGVMQVDDNQKVVGFNEKPANPVCEPGSDTCLASMGIYVFNTDFLFERLCRDAAARESEHDFGKDLIPGIIDEHCVYAFPFVDENRKQQAYWRDVGTIDAYYEANMDLVAVHPLLNLYDEHWPIRTHRPNLPPPKFVFRGNSSLEACGQAHDSMVGLGSIISGGTIEDSVVGRNVRVESHAHVQSSIVLDNVRIGKQCRIRRAIIETGTTIPAGTAIGLDPALDESRGLRVSPNGVTVVTRDDDLKQISQPRVVTSKETQTASAT